MDKNYIVALFFCVFVFFANAQSGILESYTIIDSGLGNTSYDLNPHTQTANPDFDGFNFGNFTSGSTLTLNGGRNNIYECGIEDITSGHLFYRIYETTATPPAFSDFVDLSNSIIDTGVAGCGGVNQEWETTNASVNILGTLNSGNYFIEVYSGAEYTVGGVPSAVDHEVNNAGSNFKARFRLDNPPSAICQNITVQ
jgi:hypothetical protein